MRGITICNITEKLWKTANPIANNFLRHFNRALDFSTTLPTHNRSHEPQWQTYWMKSSLHSNLCLLNIFKAIKRETMEEKLKTRQNFVAKIQFSLKPLGDSSNWSVCMPSLNSKIKHWISGKRWGWMWTVTFRTTADEHGPFITAPSSNCGLKPIKQFYVTNFIICTYTHLCMCVVILNFCNSR